MEARAGPLASPASLSLASPALGAHLAARGVCVSVVKGGVSTIGVQFRRECVRRATRAGRESGASIDVSSAPASRQGLRMNVQAHPGGVCDGGRGERGPHDPISFTDS